MLTGTTSHGQPVEALLSDKTDECTDKLCMTEAHVWASLTRALPDEDESSCYLCPGAIETAVCT